MSYLGFNRPAARVADAAAQFCQGSGRAAAEIDIASDGVKLDH